MKEPMKKKGPTGFKMNSKCGNRGSQNITRSYLLVEHVCSTGIKLA
jgi:hypothetical protein